MVKTENRIKKDKKFVSSSLASGLLNSVRRVTRSQIPLERHGTLPVAQTLSTSV
uniref:Uncharacterized protein n=1 Tax=Anguilla anguilla TaxID=7936 RepID=A0A0E9XUW5_ANGAN